MLIAFHPATEWDIGLLFEWRNDPETRANSRNTGHVNLGEHTQWVRRSLMNPDRKLMIAKDGNGTPVATVRLDRCEDGSFELSWTVAPSQRGRGIGTAAIREFIGLLPRPIHLRAEVKVANLASLKIAERAGMSVCGEREGLMLLEVKLAAEAIP